MSHKGKAPGGFSVIIFFLPSVLEIYLHKVNFYLPSIQIVSLEKHTCFIRLALKVVATHS